jgi:protein-L-isoaspartate(D-aspartate) O-methyltransferase
MHGTDFAALRQRMVDNQLRPREVSDRDVLRAFLATPRELFVEEADRPFAYADCELRLAASSGRRALMAPVQTARLIQLLPRERGAKIMVVGSGAGYSVAILSALVEWVVAVEEDRHLAARAKTALQRCGIVNWTECIGPLDQGCREHAPYDGMLLEGAVEQLPESLVAQLKPGGIAAGIERDDRIGRAMLWEKVGEGVTKWPQFEAWAPLLPGFERKREFVF